MIHCLCFFLYKENNRCFKYHSTLYTCTVKVEILVRVKFRVFFLRIEHQILARHNSSDFLYLKLYYNNKLHYVQAGCIVNETQF